MTAPPRQILLSPPRLHAEIVCCLVALPKPNLMSVIVDNLRTRVANHDAMDADEIILIRSVACFRVPYSSGELLGDPFGAIQLSRRYVAELSNVIVLHLLRRYHGRVCDDILQYSKEKQYNSCNDRHDTSSRLRARDRAAWITKSHKVNEKGTSARLRPWTKVTHNKGACQSKVLTMAYTWRTPGARSPNSGKYIRTLRRIKCLVHGKD